MPNINDENDRDLGKRIIEHFYPTICGENYKILAYEYYKDKRTPMALTLIQRIS